MNELCRNWRRENSALVNERQRERRAANPEYFSAATRAWRAANPEKVAEYDRQYKAANPEKVKAKKRRHYARHADDIAAKTAERYAADPEPFKASARRARARRKGAEGYHTAEDAARIRAEHGGLCAYCDQPGTEIDHMVSLHNGGTDWPTNLQPLCQLHNRGKSAMNDDEYRARMGEPASGKFRQWRNDEAA